MTDSTDNARGPERIWHSIDRRGNIESCSDAHVQPCDDVASAYVEYRRADLPPTDAEVMNHPKVKALVEALEFYRDGFVQKSNRTKTGLVVSVDYVPTETLLDDCGNTAIEALAAIQEGQR